MTCRAARLAYLAATNTLALLRLLPMSDREKDVEILALRHQLLVLQRQVGKPAFTDTDRAVLANLLHHLPMHRLRHLLLPVRPDTALRRHRNLLKQRHAATRAKAPRTPAHPALDPHPGPTPGTRECLLRLSSNPRRTRGAGIKVAASTVWEIL